MHKLSKFILLPLAYMTLFACQETGVLELGYEKDLIPEGIALSTDGKKIYLSSILKNKIIEFNTETGLARDFISPGQYGYKSGVGLTVKDTVLFALGSSLKDGSWSSILLALDLRNGDLLHRFMINDTTSHLMNDLAIDAENGIYISDTMRHLVYKLDYPQGEITVFLESDQIYYPNGIALSDDGKRLFVDSYASGLRIVDLQTKQILNPPDTTLVGFDGLKYHNGDLYAIRNAGDDDGKHGLLKLDLNTDQDRIEGMQPLLMAHEKMDVPTTFAIYGDMAYILANSQLRNLNQEAKQIIDSTKLTNTYIIKYPLN